MCDKVNLTYLHIYPTLLKEGSHAICVEIKVKLFNTRLLETMQAQYQSLLHRCHCDWLLEEGVDCVASSHLPSHSDVHTSVLSKERIKVSLYSPWARGVCFPPPPLLLINFDFINI